MRTFVAVIGGFVLVVLVFIVVLLMQSRRLEGYADQVIRDARPRNVGSASPCSEVSRASAPGGVKTCRVVPESDGLRVILDLTNGQRYELTR